MHPTIKIADGVSSLLHKEERWKPPTCSRLQSAQCNHSQKQVPTPSFQN